MDVSTFCQHLKKTGTKRGFVVFDKGQLTSSGGIFDEVADFYQNESKDFAKHEASFFEYNEKTDSLFGAFISNTTRGAGHGGARLWNYNNVTDFVTDGLRLSQGMGRKSALAGIWWGGGKGLIAKNNHSNYSDDQYRDLLFGEYGRFVTSLRGCYYGAEDVGLTEADTARMFKTSRFITCIPKQFGGSGNPSGMTAKGTVSGMEGGLHFRKAGDTLKGKKIVMQGAGNVASFMIGYLLAKDVSEIIASDINENVLNRAKNMFKSDNRVKFVLTERDDNSILEEECDVLAPNALGGIITEELVSKIKAPVICGAANNQLANASIDKMLKERGIVYVPDFLNNRMGIVNCANESYGYVENDEAIEKHFARTWKHSIFNTTMDVLNEAEDKNIGSDEAAKKIADRLQEEEHPIFGHRGIQIIRSIVKSNWVNEAN
eukprot:gene2220-2394_t